MATYVLEAVIVAMIMTSAVLFVGTFELSSTPMSSVLEANLAPHVMDLLRVTNDLPSKTCGARNQLEQLVVEGASGQHDFWNQKVAAALGPAVRSGMVLDNLHGLYPLHGDTNMVGDTRDLTIMPDFGRPTSILTAPATGVSPMKIDVPSARFSELVRLRGEAVRTTIQTTDLTSSRSYQAWSPTAILGNDPRDGLQDIGWNMTKLHRDSSWNFTRIVDAADLQYYIQGQLDNFFIRVNGTPGSQGVRIPANTSLQIDFPRGWTVGDSPNLPWSSKISSSAAGTSVAFVALQDVAGIYSLKINALPPSSPARPFDVIRAHAFNGSFGESTLLVQYPVPASPDLPRQVFPTTPYPVRPGTMALFGASFANGGGNTTVTQLDFEIPGGYDVVMNRGAGAALFNTSYAKYSGDIVGVDDHGGSWSIVDARHARWTADPLHPVSVPALSVTWWGAELPITNRTDQTTSIEPIVGEGPTVQLKFPNGFDINATAWGKSPGIIEVSVPNESTTSITGLSRHDGYSTLPGDSTFSSTVRGPRGYQFANGSFSSSAANAAQTDSAAANSTFSVRDRRAPLGSLARVDADLESVMELLSAQGITDSNLTIDLYAPPNFGCAPTHSWNISGKSLPRPAVRALAFDDILGLGSPDAILGVEDHKLYRVDAQGRAVWVTPLASTAQRIASWDGGATHRSVLAGDDKGTLYAVDAVTGKVSWSRCVAASPCDDLGSLARGVTGIAVDVARDHIVITTADGRLTLLDGSGRVLTQRAAGAYAFAFFLGTGDVVAQNNSASGTLELLSVANDLSIIQAAPGTWLAAAPALSATDEHTVRLVSPVHVVTINDSTFQPVGGGTRFTPTRALTAASGDASGDGVPELAIAMEDKSVWIFDGATGAMHKYDTPLFPPLKQVPPISPSRVGAVDTCDPIDGTSNWEAPTCRPPPDRDTLEPSTMPPLLVVGSAGIVDEYELRGEARVTVLDSEARAKWDQYVTNGHLPTALASGKWGLADTIGVGYDDGSVEAWPTTADTVAPRQRVSPSTVAGTFTFTFPVPAGGFFGSHLLVANLTWVDASAASHSVRLADWLEVVDRDGVPVAHPTYRAVIAFEPLDSGGHSR